MSNQQQPPYGGPGGQQPYGGQPQPGYGPPPGQQPPGQQPPGQQPPGQPPRPQQAPQQPGPQQPGQYQQPGYGGQYPPQQPPQQGYPGQQQYQQGYPGQQQYQQQGFPGQQPQYGGQQPWAGQQPPRKSGGNGKTLLIAGGAFALVAIIGVVLALIFKGGDDQADPTPIPTGAPTAQPTGEPTGQPTEQPTGEPTASPTAEPTTQPSTGGDEGIAVAEGVYVKPASGYVRQSLDGYSGVFLVKQGEGIFMVAAAKTTESSESILSAVVKANTKSLTSAQTKPVKTARPGPDDKTPVKVLMSQAYSGVRTSQSGSFEAVGFVAVIERNDGVITVAQAYGRKDKLATLDPDSTAMLKSVLESQ